MKWLIVGLLVVALLCLPSCDGQGDFVGISNPEWEPVELEARVAELAQEYEAAHPYTLENVCWDMSVELWQILEDNGITSFIVLRTGEEDVWLGHVWLIVKGKDNLVLVIESTTGTVYSPSYCKAQPDSDRAYAEYERRLEGYFYRNPAALEAEYPQLFTCPFLKFLIS